MRFGFALGLMLVSTLPVRSADAESKTPYVWRVVLQSQVHPALSIPVRERLCKDLKAALQPGVGGDLGRHRIRGGVMGGQRLFDDAQGAIRQPLIGSAARWQNRMCHVMILN